MLHPDTELGVVSAEIGVGIFATRRIPQGTIVYIKDPLEIEIAPNDPRLQDTEMRHIVDRYAYVEPGGAHVISWDLAKYMNHSCEANSMSTGYGFEIALRDIQAGEQITDEYGLFNMEKNMHCGCGADMCRGWIRQDDAERYSNVWDTRVRLALEEYLLVSQPLEHLLAPAIGRQLRYFLKTGQTYVSVSQLRYRPREVEITGGFDELSTAPGVG